MNHWLAELTHRPKIMRAEFGKANLPTLSAMTVRPPRPGICRKYEHVKNFIASKLKKQSASSEQSKNQDHSSRIVEKLYSDVRSGNLRSVRKLPTRSIVGRYVLLREQKGVLKCVGKALRDSEVSANLEFEKSI